MSRGRPGAGGRDRRQIPERRDAPADVGALLAATAAGAALVGTALLVDPGAESAFDGPKRLAGLGAIALGVCALALGSRTLGLPAGWRSFPLAPRVALVAYVAALAWSLLSAVLSARPAVALDAWRATVLLALAVPLGASRALDGRRGPLLLALFLSVSGVNAVVAVVQGALGVQPLPVERFGGRVSAVGLIGNEGVLAVMLALAVVAGVALVITTRSTPMRLGAGAATVTALAGLATTGNLTAAAAVGTGVVVLGLARSGRRAVPAILVGLLLAAVGLATVPEARSRAGDLIRDLRGGEWDRMLTYRLGPWAAALEMTRARPWVGWGPGAFAAEFVPHRLRAEERYRVRLVNPALAGSYAEAHSDYLQALAETGIPGLVAAASAAGALLAGLVPVLRERDDRRRAEAVLLVAVLAAGAAAALTWFPLQRMGPAVPILLGAGRAWRLAVAPAPGPTR